MALSCRHGWIRLRLRITNGRGGCGYTSRAAVLVHAVQVTWAAQPSPGPPRRRLGRPAVAWAAPPSRACKTVRSNLL